MRRDPKEKNHAKEEERRRILAQAAFQAHGARVETETETRTRPSEGALEGFCSLREVVAVRTMSRRVCVCVQSVMCGVVSQGRRSLIDVAETDLRHRVVKPAADSREISHSVGAVSPVICTWRD